MKNKTLLITLIVFLVVLGVAAALYPKLSADMQAQQPATMPTATTAATEAAAQETEEAAETTATTEATEPEAVPAPDFTVQDWDGNEVQLFDYFGKPIVLNFWGHWCGPCESEMPEFNEVWEELGGEVTFLMVHVGPDVEDGKAKVTENEYTFPVLFDNESAAANFYGIGAYPTSIFINAEGHIKAYYIGMMDRDLLQRGIDMIYQTEE